MSDDAPIQGPPKPKASRKGGHKGSVTEVRMRRAKVAVLRAQGVKPDAIWAQLKGDFPHVTLKVIYDDCEYVKRHAKEYVALEYLPEFGDAFQRAIIVLEEINAECWKRYKAGDIEMQRTKLPDGKVIEKVIRREGDSAWLKLAAEANMAVVNLATSGPVSEIVTRVSSEYKRLREQQEKVMEPVATT